MATLQKVLFLQPVKVQVNTLLAIMLMTVDLIISVLARHVLSIIENKKKIRKINGKSGTAGSSDQVQALSYRAMFPSHISQETHESNRNLGRNLYSAACRHANQP